MKVMVRTMDNHRMGRHKRTGKEEVVIVLGSSDFSSQKTKFGDLQYALHSLTGLVEDEMQTVFDEVGEEGARKLQLVSKEKFNGKGTYAAGWTYDKARKVGSRTMSMIRNKNQPQLTHLLEFGHPIFNQYGKTDGYADGVSHIEDVAKWVDEEVTKRITNDLNNL